MDDNEINEAVARKLGWTKCEHSTMEKGEIVPAIGWIKPNPIKPHFHEGLPDYCHSIEAAWGIVEALDNDFAMFKGCNGGWVVNIKGELTKADTALMAIALAFLKLP